VVTRCAAVKRVRGKGRNDATFSSLSGSSLPLCFELLTKALCFPPRWIDRSRLFFLAQFHFSLNSHSFPRTSFSPLLKHCLSLTVRVGSPFLFSPRFSETGALSPPNWSQSWSSNPVKSIIEFLSTLFLSKIFNLFSLEELLFGPFPLPRQRDPYWSD